MHSAGHCKQVEVYGCSLQCSRQAMLRWFWAACLAQKPLNSHAFPHSHSEGLVGGQTKAFPTDPQNGVVEPLVPSSGAATEGSLLL